MVTIDEDDYLAHYGTPRKSGRYPWGSGDNVIAVPTRNKDFLGLVRELRAQGLTDSQIQAGMGMKSTEFRARNSIARNAVRQEQINQARALKFDRGLSNVAGAAKMGIPESTFRTLIADGAADRADKLTSTADMLRRQVDEKKYVDVGVGVETQLKLSSTMLGTAVAILKQEGYVVESVPVQQLGTDKETRVKVLAPPGEDWVSIAKNKDKIRQIQEYSDDGGKNWMKPLPPLPLSPKRVQVVHGDEGGADKDGLIYVRPPTPEKQDLSLGNNTYGQVRIQVGDSHYLKGMAVYKDDMPPGVDIMFHTNKANTGNPLDAMKPLKTDKDGKISEELPFGSIVRQITKDGKVTSVMNPVGSRETSGIEGSWDDWASTLSSQMLSKQPPSLAKKQLDKTYDDQKKTLDEIMALTNPVVKKRMLQDFADGADSAAVHLKAAHLPRQATKVILPINSLKDNEVYAPGFNAGEPVVLIRYPHGGTFEIPELVVNNKNREAIKLLGDAKDAVGINAKVAQHLSGADFDGDTVIIIPNSSRKVKHSSPLEGLKGFDPRTSYPAPEGMKRMSSKTKGIQMGMVSNLITDMTIRKAPHAEIVRAVRHSMAVIDAEKHPIDWKYSYQANGIKALAEKYQVPYRESGYAGASTLISRARSEQRLPQRKPRPMSEGGPIDKKTGERVFVPTGRKRRKRDGTEELITEKHDALAVTKDARDLSSGTNIEAIYASHSNRLKTLANQARLESLKTPRVKQNPSAKRTYADQVKSLNSKLEIALANAPRERQAQIVGNTIYKARLQANPELESSTKKKLKYQVLEEARIRTGAKKTQVVFTDDEWDAIQAGAISTSVLERLLNHADPDRVKALATPRTQRLMTSSKTTKALNLLAQGYTRAEVANKLGVSVSTLDLSLNA
jgi:hypothetical protein